MSADPMVHSRMARLAERRHGRGAAALFTGGALARASGAFPYEPEGHQRPSATATDGSDEPYGLEIPNSMQHVLAFASRLHLGTSFGAPLYVEAPSGYVPTTSKAEMLAIYLNGWSETLHPDSAGWASLVIDRRTRAQLPEGTSTGIFDSIEDALSSIWGAIEDVLTPFGGTDLSDPVPGLFWTEDYLNGALVMAVQTAYAFAPVLKHMAPEPAEASGYRDGDLVRELISGAPDPDTGQVRRIKIVDAPVLVPEVGGITVGSDGKVTLSSRGGVVAYTILGNIWIRSPVRDRAALADYLFWWAHRCYALGIDTGDPTYKLVGQAAAKCALAEIVWLASLITHEIGHHAGVPYDVLHCGADMCCNQYAADFVFANLSAGAIGLPPAASRLEPRDLGEGDGGFETLATPSDCLDSVFHAEHTSDSVTQPVWRVPHQVTLESRVDPGCGGSGTTYTSIVGPSSSSVVV